MSIVNINKVITSRTAKLNLSDSVVFQVLIFCFGLTCRKKFKFQIFIVIVSLYGGLFSDDKKPNMLYPFTNMFLSTEVQTTSIRQTRNHDDLWFDLLFLY